MGMSPRLLRPRASGFNPKSLANLAGWWDASVTASLLQLSTGSTAVSATDDPVGYWADQSGNGRHLTQSTTNNRPFYKPATLNNLATLAFDGSNDTLGASFTLAQPCHHFIVFRFQDAYTSGNPRVFDGFGVNAGFYRASALSMVLNYGASNDNADVTDAEMQTFGVWDTEANGTASFIRRAGVRRDSADTNIGTGSPSGIRLAMFNNGFSAPGKISVAEVLIYSRALSASEATRVRTYLGKKWNLAYA